MNLSTYIINLEKDIERKNYVSRVLSPYVENLLRVKWIKAVEGKKLTEKELDSVFDRSLAFKRYGRYLNLGEIGCVLSHFKCYKALIESSDEYALVLEDDITILKKLYWTNEMHETLQTEEPVILFLSGDYWFTKIIKKGDINIASVYDAVGSYAYVINRAAAQLILKKNTKTSFVSDNWSLYRNQGVTLKAIYPYMIDANIEDFVSSVRQEYWGEIRKNMSLAFVVKSYVNALVKRYLLSKGHFVSKIRK